MHHDPGRSPGRQIVRAFVAAVADRGEIRWSVDRRQSYADIVFRTEHKIGQPDYKAPYNYAEWRLFVRVQFEINGDLVRFVAA